MKNIFSTLIVITFLGFIQISQAQIVVTGGGLNGTTLAQNLAGSNITVTNATVSGNVNQSGTFTFSGAGLDVNSGVILSTGNIFDAVGPNSSGSTSTGYNGPGNTLLTNLAGQTTRDAVVLQFDFEVQSDEIEFNYIFLSEEYNEWVGSAFNDVFAFYISGPGITGEENLAVVPGTTTPVSINTINDGSFWQYYVDNEDPPFVANIEYDGFTTLMTASKSGLIPCETYTLKLMIADAGDAALDAAVLLQENSLVQANVSATANTFSMNNIALEGCIQASFTFQLDSALSTDSEIPIEIAGTAINGVDYAHIDSLIIIPAGQTSATIVIDAYGDGITEGQETIELIFAPAPCEVKDTVTLYIDDYNMIEYITTPYDLNCNGDSSGSVDLGVTGGIPPYYITLTDSATSQTETYTTNPVTDLTAGTYYVQVMDGYGCSAQDIVYGDMFDGGPVFIPDGTGLSYETTITISGFGAGQTLSSVDQIQSICMNMEHSRIGELEIKLRAPDGTEVILKQQPGGAVTNMGEPCAIGPADAGNTDTTAGIGYDYCFTPNPTFPTMNSYANVNQYTYVTTCYGTVESDKYLPPGSYESSQSLAALVGVPLNGDWKLIITDEIPNNNGWIFNWSISLSADQPDSVFTILEPTLPTITTSVTEADCGLSNGAIDITVTGDYGPYSYDWSTGATSEDLSGIPSGSYSVTITGTDLCEYVYDFNLSNNGSLVLSAVTNNTSCYLGTDGDIDLSVSGGTPTFNYSWSNGATTEDISGLAPGTYTVTVTDGGACEGIESYIIDDPALLITSAVITDENCGDEEGIIALSVTGGTAPYAYLWSNGVTTALNDELASGTYYVTVTDTNLCTKVDSFTVINYVGNCIPDCDLEISSYILTDEMCGNTNGSIDITVFTSNSPYIAEWSNGATTEDISGLMAGTYTVTLTDAEDCEHVQDFTVINESGTLAILGFNTTDEICGNSQGSIDMTVNGGALPYTYNWSNGATTQDLSNIQAGTYSVTVTDGNYCSVVSSATISNLTGTLSYTWGNAVNEVCGNGQGSIDILINGGQLPYNYSWSNGATTEDLTNLSAGDYYCVVTDNNGCSVTTPTFTVTNDGGDLTIYNIDLDNEICGNGLGEIELFVNGGVSPYLYSWSNGETTSVSDSLSAGTYTATVTDQNGCQISSGNMTLINEAGTLTLDGITTTEEICNNSQGGINITVSGGTPAYLFNWSNGSTSEDLTNVPAGAYSCTVTDLNGCQIFINSTVTENQGTLNLLNTIVTDENCGDVDGAIDLYISGGTAPITYNWNSGQTTEDISGIAAGNYSCTVTDNQGCEVLAMATVVNNTGNLSIDNQVITNETCGDNNGSVDLTIGGTATPFTYIWSNGATTQDITGLGSGVYTCTVSDNLLCDIIAGPYTINSYSGSFVVSNTVVGDENCGSGNGTVDITITGGVAPITYNWSTGATTEDISGLSAGTYYYTVTDANCVITDSVIVGNDAGNLNLDSYIITNEVCSNGAASIDVTVSGGTGPYIFNWSNGSTTEDLSGLSAGVYTLTITDQFGCSIVSNNLNVSNDPGTFNLVDITVTNEQCADTSGLINVTVSGGTFPITYLWSNASTSQDLFNVNAGTYSCTATDFNGCELIYSASVQNDGGSLLIAADTITDETCGDVNGGINIEINGGTAPITYSWSNGSTTEDLSGVNSGNYTCVVTDSNGCTAVYNGVIANISGDFLISYVDYDDEICSNSNGYVNITVNGGATPYIYSWNTGSSNEDLSSLDAGYYAVTVTDQNGCSDTTSVSLINTNGNIQIDSIVVTNEHCSETNGEIDLTYSGDYSPSSIYWSNGATSEDLTNLSEGWYYVTVVDALGCTVQDSAFVLNFTNGFEITGSSEANEYCADSSGYIDLTLTGGFVPYTYNWSSGDTTEDLSNLTSGIYSCTITDTSGCNIYYSYEVVNITNGLQLDSSIVNDEYCYNLDGFIDVSISGGVWPYTYLWINGDTTQDLTNITGGTYILTVTDGSSCKIFTPVYTVNSLVNNSLGFSSVTVSDESCGNGQGQILFTPTGGTVYDYELNGSPIASTVVNNLSAGTYTITLNEYGCSTDTTVTLNNVTTFTAQIDSVLNENCGDGSGGIFISVSPAGTYYYNWSNSVTFEDNTMLSAGTYTVEITDTAGCLSILTADVINNTGFAVGSIVT
ncbi:MAG: hypothetical protein C0592_11060, partial [Marinilabiliales bacterium]